jgi:hypothetical protein
MIWPIEARTVKSRPKNFSIVFALAGDSTITSFFFIETLPDLGYSTEPVSKQMPS